MIRLIAASLVVAGTLCFAEGPNALDEVAKEVKANDLLALANKVKGVAKGDRECILIASDVDKCVRLWFVGIDVAVKDYEFLAKDPDLGAEVLVKSFEPLVRAAELNAWTGSHVVVAIGSLAWKRQSEEIYRAAVDALSRILWHARPMGGTFQYSLPAVRAADFLASFAKNQPVSEELKQKIKRNLLWTAVHDTSMEIYRAARAGADSLEPGLGDSIDRKRRELGRSILK